jgi:superfamily II DNA/RNA helicase
MPQQKRKQQKQQQGSNKRAKFSPDDQVEKLRKENEALKKKMESMLKTNDKKPKQTTTTSESTSTTVADEANNIQSMSINAPLKKALKALKLDQLTSTQAKLIPTLLDSTARNDLLVGVPSGTSLSSIIFVAQRIINYSIRHEDKLDKPTIHSIVLTSDVDKVTHLVHTARNVFEKIGNKIKRRKQLYVNSASSTEELKQNGLHVLIATPEQLTGCIDSIDVSDTQFFIVENLNELLTFEDTLVQTTSKVNSSVRKVVIASEITDEVSKLASKIMKQFTKIEITGEESNPIQVSAVDTVIVDNAKRIATLLWIIKQNLDKKIIVFTTMKYIVKFIGQLLSIANIGHISLHGQENKKARRKEFTTFLTDATRKVFVVSETGGRDLPIPDKSHFYIQYDLPLDNIADFVNRFAEYKKNEHQTLIMLTEQEKRAATEALSLQPKSHGEITKPFQTIPLNKLQKKEQQQDIQSAIDKSQETVVQAVSSKSPANRTARNIVRSYLKQVYTLLLKQYKLLNKTVPAEEFLQCFAISEQELSEEVPQKKNKKNKKDNKKKDESDKKVDLNEEKEDDEEEDDE